MYPYHKSGFHREVHIIIMFYDTGSIGLLDFLTIQNIYYIHIGSPNGLRIDYCDGRTVY